MRSTFQAFSITRTGIYLPPDLVSSAELDKRLNIPHGSIEKNAHVQSRRFIKNELPSTIQKLTISQPLYLMAAPASPIPASLQKSQALSSRMITTNSISRNVLKHTALV